MLFWVDLEPAITCSLAFALTKSTLTVKGQLLERHSKENTHRRDTLAHAPLLLLSLLQWSCRTLPHAQRTFSK